MDISKLPKENKRVLLAAAVDGALKPSDMKIETTPFDAETAQLKEGQVLVANNYVSVDPVTRTFLESKQDAMNPVGCSVVEH